MLMVTSSVRMLNGVHAHTSDHGPSVPLCLVLEVGATGLQDGLVDPSASSNDPDHCPVGGWDNFLGSGWKLDPARD